MTERNENEQHEAETEETLWEWIKRRWREFMQDFGTALAIIWGVVILAGVGAALYYLFHVPANVWFGILGALAAIGVILAAFRFGGMGGIAALLVVAVGVTYHLSGDCDWPLTRRVCGSVLPPDYSECDPRNPDYSEAKCGERPRPPKTCEELGNCLEKIPEVVYGGKIGNECAEEVERLRKKKKPAQCFEILHVTNRALEGDTYGRGISDISAGKSIVLTPFKLPQGSITEYCRRFDKVDLETANLFEKFIIYSFGLTRNPVCVSDDNGKLPDVSAEFEIKSQKQYFDERARLREGNQRSDWVGLAKTLRGDGLNGLFKDVNEYIRQQEKLGVKEHAVLIYIHGFDNDFASSVETLAHLTADLNFQDNRNADDERIHSLGIPIALSWPTRLATDGIVDPEIRESVELNYVESQLIASATAKQFATFLVDLAKNTSVTEINVIAHSMGNRILNSLLGPVEGGILNSKGNAVTLRVVHAAADLGIAEFAAQLPSQEGFVDLTYFSRSDAPLKRSKEIQLIKQLGRVVFASGQSDFQQKLQDFREILDVETEFSELRKRAIVNELKEREDRLAKLVSISGLTVDEFLAEDDCRVGGGVEFADECFRALVSAADRSSIIDASGFVPEVGLDYVFGAGHGYFWNSPAVVAEISCALRDEKPAPDGPRPLRETEFTLSDGEVRRYFSLDASVTSSSDCAMSISEYIFERKSPVARLSPFSVYFRLNKATPAYIAPVQPGSAATEATQVIRNFVQELSSDDTGRLIVRGYADASGSESLNQDLSMRRADYVRSLIQGAGYRGEVDAYGLGEYPASDGINQAVEANREPVNRRVDLSVE